MKIFLCQLTLCFLVLSSSADTQRAGESMARFMLDYCKTIDDLSYCLISLGYECREATNVTSKDFNCTYPLDDKLMIYELTRPTESHGWLMRKIVGPED